MSTSTDIRYNINTQDLKRGGNERCQWILSVQNFITLLFVLFKKGAYRIGDITQWLSIHTTLAEDLGSVPGTHKASHKCLTPVPRDLIPTFELHGHYVHMV